MSNNLKFLPFQKILPGFKIERGSKALLSIFMSWISWGVRLNANHCFL